MVEITAFKGLTYNKEKIKNLDEVMAPPYDIISPELQKHLYEKHPKNVVRLILGMQKKSDNKEDNRYTRAKRFLDRWLKETTLITSDKPAVYPYKINYRVNGSLRTMNGFFILLKLDPEYKEIKAHERTLSKPKEDRLNLMRACQANLEPIQLLFIDEKDVIRKKIDELISNSDPLIDVKGYDGFNHKIWMIDDEETISFLKKQFRGKTLFIADGHHRYQTSINYANEMRKKTGSTTGMEPYDYRLVVLVNMFDEGLVILPTHRLIKKSDVDVSELIKKLEEFFMVEKKEIRDIGNNYELISKKIREDIETKNQHKFALYHSGTYYVLTLRDEKTMDLFSSGRSKTWRTLDVSILHKIVLEHLMGINESNIEEYVKYTRDDEEALKFVDEGKFNLSIIMNPTRIEELKAVAEAGEHMPQKSTYFLPKMLSGLVMYKMNIEKK